MSKISNSFMLQVVIKLLILLAIAKSISLAIWWFSPSDGVELQIEDNYSPKYQRVDFSNMLEGDPSIQNGSTASLTSSSGVSIKNMILKGLYGDGSNGFAIVALKSSAKKTSIVSVGDEFSGYILKTILSDSVIFTKASTEYVLEMYQRSALSKALGTGVNESSYPVGISRKDITFYANNPKQIWKDIAISEVKEGEEIKGFKVNSINEKSKMYELGLKKGDLIVEVNNVRLKSYKDAISIYKDIANITSVQVVVLRNNIEMELVYEIN